MSAPVARRYFLRAREALRRGDLGGASEGFSAAVELAPDFVEARIGHALILSRSNTRAATQSLRTALGRVKRAGERAHLLCALGDVLVAADDYLGAEAAYAEASGLPNASPARLHDRLARLRAKTGNYAAAIDELLAAARG